MKSKKVYFAQGGILLALLALAGCMTAVKNEDSSVIRARAVERWNFLIARHAEKAYDYLTPGYRATKTREAYAQEMNHRGIRWSKVGFGSQQCEVDVCHVHLTVDYRVNLGGPAGDTKTTGFVAETWIKAAGRWYFLPEQLQPTKLGKDSTDGS